jgi:hypothetical protein
MTIPVSVVSEYDLPRAPDLPLLYEYNLLYHSIVIGYFGHRLRVHIHMHKLALTTNLPTQYHYSIF